jgi:general secretion pathway protein G
MISFKYKYINTKNHPGQRQARLLGFTLVELLISVAIMGTLASMAMMGYRNLIEETREKVVMQELNSIQNYIEIYLQENGELPDSLDDLGMGTFEDPWGNPYRYQAVDKVPPGMRRKDLFLNPINDDYDLWSMGPDGKSQPPLTAQQSRDDIIRATDGEYIGPASEF